MVAESKHAGTNWGVGKGWSWDRWCFWRNRFREISEMKVLPPETRQVAKNCADRMEEVEKSTS